MMLGCPGAHGHLLANQTLLFEASLCRPTAPGLPIWGTGDFGTSPIFGQLSDKPLLASNQISGVWGRKAQWRIEILMPTKKRFLWCWRRRPLVRPEVAAEIDGSQQHGAGSSKNLRDARLLNYFAQPDKLICALIWLHVTPIFKIMHRRGADRA